MALTWIRGPGGAKLPAVKVEHDPTPEAHRINCEEFAMMAYMTLGHMSMGNYRTDPLAKEAINNTYSLDIDANEYGIKFWDEYCALKDNTTTVKQEDKISDYDNYDPQEGVDFTVEEDEEKED